ALGVHVVDAAVAVVVPAVVADLARAGVHARVRVVAVVAAEAEAAPVAVPVEVGAPRAAIGDRLVRAGAGRASIEGAGVPVGALRVARTADPLVLAAMVDAAIDRRRHEVVAVRVLGALALGG